MALLKLDCVHSENFRRTYLLKADKEEDFLEDLCKNLMEKWEWITVSNSMPVIMEHYLFYTVTVTAGMLV